MIEFKDIPGYEGEYQATSDGRILSLKRSGVPSNRFRKLQKHTAGYLSINLRASDPHLVHRLIALTFIPNPENKRDVNHKNGNKHDNRIENLEWCTRQENEDHAFSTGLKNSTGSANMMSKLTEDDVKRIRESKDRIYIIAREHNVHWQTVKRILNRKIWKHVA